MKKLRKPSAPLFRRLTTVLLDGIAGGGVDPGWPNSVEGGHATAERQSSLITEIGFPALDPK